MSRISNRQIGRNLLQRYVTNDNINPPNISIKELSSTTNSSVIVEDIPLKLFKISDNKVNVIDNPVLDTFNGLSVFDIEEGDYYYISVKE